jgi:hypothetical protein
MKTYIGNAFSLNMVANIGQHSLKVTPVSLEQVKLLIVAAAVDGGAYSGVPLQHNIIPAIGHVNTAAIVDNLLGIGVTGTPGTGVHFTTFGGRVSVSLEIGDGLLVAQYVGPRLDEGATSLPDGAKIEWFAIGVDKF